MNASPLNEDGRCGLCSRGLNGFDRVYSFGEYDGTLRRLIHLFKYSGFKPLAAPFGRLLLSALPRDQPFDLIVPMPLHWRRAWQRGFNQAELLSRVVSKRIHSPVVNALRRKRPTRIQAGLTNAERRDNVAGAFELRPRKTVQGSHVLLIDDVLTTGATASAAALALKRAGARRVTTLTLARVDRRRSVFAREVM
jgi:ComF family protein